MRTGLVPGEILRKEGLANLTRGWEAVGGKLYLTNWRLIFEAHFFNFQVGDLMLDLRQVQTVKPARARLFGVPVTPNAVEVTLRDGQAHSFTVYHRKTWVAEIDAARHGVV